jgi:hypothetical protein
MKFKQWMENDAAKIAAKEIIVNLLKSDEDKSESEDNIMSTNTRDLSSEMQDELLNLGITQEIENAKDIIKNGILVSDLVKKF